MSDDDILDKIAELNKSVEMASLLPDRHYLIFNEVDDENVSMSVYDTTDIDLNNDYISGSQILVQGLMELMETDIERVLEMGMARIVALDTSSEIPKIADTSLGDNIVKVDFGKKH